ncbi:MAG: glutathione S-transferase family protein [Brevundimonas sp.]|uniref:glutathione S-transferase family protein n=1 Tax=Brevundimonas sp. TaxID=1871086 RepID=UPI0011FD2239|nr:glutathione S-transferase family protein [Brevundimonas sp.]RZJ18603.1 MAG: glutathione S-transferase family protein [Brevundimonas sp.]
MILIGQYDSPFVRRVGIAAALYGVAFQNQPWSTFGEGDRIAAYNPTRRVPALVLDDGAVVVDSACCLDWLDDQQRAAGDEALIPASGVARREILYRTALATGLSDKIVALFYEKALHEVRSQVWLDRCRAQIHASLTALEALRATATDDWLMGDALTHADIALGCALQHARESSPDEIDLTAWPALSAHNERCEALAPFRAIYKPFTGPADS